MTARIPALLALVAFLACSHRWEQPIHEIDLPTPHQKLDLDVRLVITDEFRNAEWSAEPSGDSFVVPVGPNLAHHARQLMRSVFEHPIVEATTGGSLLMTPHLTFLRQKLPSVAWGRATTLIEVEWTLSTTSGEIVWQSKELGTAVSAAGNFITERARQRSRLREALRELFENSQSAMLSSAVLRKLAAEAG